MSENRRAGDVAVPVIDGPDTLKAAAFGARDLLVEMTQALVRADSQTPPSDTGRVAEVAASFLADLPNVDVTLHPSDAPVVNLVARVAGARSGPRLVLNGHLDTYPIGDPSSWRFDPLGGDVVDGRLYGRGSADMKGGIAAQLLVMRIFAEHDAMVRGELVLALAGDEESMGECGTQRLLDTVPEVRGDAVIVADVGSPSVVRCGEKGLLWIDLLAEGTSAHGAHVHRGVNAIDRLMAALGDIKTLESMAIDPPAEVERTLSTAQAVSEPLGGTGEREVLGRITVNVGRVDGGTSPNLVPNRATARLDIRLPMGTTVTAVEQVIDRLLRNHSGVSFEVLRRYEPTWTSPDHAIVRACLAAAGKTLLRPVVANMRVGGSDARLWRRAGIPTIVSGLTPYNLGAPDEYLDVEELCQLAAIHALTASLFLSGEV